MRSPARDSRWRTTWPLEASSGAVPVGALPAGPGRLIACQLRLTQAAADGDPAARAILADLLRWAADGHHDNP